MDTLVKALAPVFAAGFALQQFLEIIDPLLAQIVKDPMWKKVVMGIISLVVGLVFSAIGGFRVLTTLFQTSNSSPAWDHPVLDVIVTGLILSAGTEGFNSIMKFLGYAKEDKKAEAATAVKSATHDSLRRLNRE